MILSQHQLFIALFQSHHSLQWPQHEPTPFLGPELWNQQNMYGNLKTWKLLQKLTLRKSDCHKIIQNLSKSLEESRLLPEFFWCMHFFHPIETSTVYGLTKWRAWQFQWYTKGKKHHFWQILSTNFGQASLKQLRVKPPWSHGWSFNTILSFWEISLFAGAKWSRKHIAVQ